jgi:membrane protease YdiL (CAAX protease family)
MSPTLPNAIRDVYWNRRSDRLRMPFRLAGAVGLFGMLFLAATPALRFLPTLPRVYEGLIGTGVQATLATVTVAVAVRFLDRRSFDRIGCVVSRRSGRDVIVGLLTGTGLVTGAVSGGLGLGWVEINDTIGTTSGVDVVAGVIAYALLMGLIGFHEELFVRGYLLTNLYEGFQSIGDRAALLIATVASSSVFAAAHAVNPNASVISTLGLFALGFLFATGYVFTGSLGFPIGAHIAWNFVMGIGFGLPVSGMETTAFVLDAVEVGPDVFTGGAFGPEAGLLGITALLGGIALTYLWATAIRPSDRCSARPLSRRVDSSDALVRTD